MILLDFPGDDASAMPAYKYALDRILQRGKLKGWSALVDDFRTFRALDAGILEICAEASLCPLRAPLLKES